MNERIKRIITYQKTKQNETFEGIISDFQRMMQYHLQTIHDFYKQDVKQEMLIAIYQFIMQYKIHPICISIEPFNQENFIQIKNANFQNVDQLFNHPYLSMFIQTYGTNLFEQSFMRKDALHLFLYEYELFCNEIQLFRYMNKKLKCVCCDFLRKNRKLETIRLDETDDSNEYMADISEMKNACIDVLDLTDVEIQFLKSFIQKGTLLTEKEVAKKLGITQQAVHKRKKKIIEKYKMTKKKGGNQK